MIHDEACVREAGARALATLLTAHPDNATPTIKKLIQTFNDKLEMTPAVKDQYDRVIQEPIDLWQVRLVRMMKNGNGMIEISGK